MKEQTLIQLKEKIEDAKKKLAELQGRKQLLEEQMQKQWNCTTTTELEKLLNQKIEEEKTINTKIDTLYKKIKEKYDFG